MDIIHPERHKQLKMVVSGVFLCNLYGIRTLFRQQFDGILPVGRRRTHPVSGARGVCLVAECAAQRTVDISGDSFFCHIHAPVQPFVCLFRRNLRVVPVPEIAAVVVPQITGSVQQRRALFFPGITGSRSSSKNGSADCAEAQQFPKCIIHDAPFSVYGLTRPIRKNSRTACPSTAPEQSPKANCCLTGFAAGSLPYCKSAPSIQMRQSPLSGSSAMRKT